jgi:hypothetical protein
MGKAHNFFKYCYCCGERFTPLGKDVKKCPNCKQISGTLIHLERISISLDNLILKYNLLDNNHIMILDNIKENIEKEIQLLKEDLKENESGRN